MIKVEYVATISVSTDYDSFDEFTKELLKTSDLFPNVDIDVCYHDLTITVRSDILEIAQALEQQMIEVAALFDLQITEESL